MSELFREVIIEPSKWALEQEKLPCGPVVVKIGRVDLDDEEQREEIDPEECPSCSNAKDILKYKSSVINEEEEVQLAATYHCPCAHIWHKDLQVEEKNETTETTEQVDEEEKVHNEATSTSSNS